MNPGPSYAVRAAEPAAPAGTIGGPGVRLSWAALRAEVDAVAVEPDAVIAWCKGQIARRKLPSLGRVVEAFPITVAGEVQKSVRRDAQAPAR